MSTILRTTTMTAAQSTDWRNEFHGRDASLAYLVERWHEAQAGKPTLAVLVGPTGIGKTRLVQEFYRWLTRHADPRTDAAPQGYWPDAFHDDATSGRVNPVFDAQDERPLPPIPFLWWGLKFDDPSTEGPARERVPLSVYAPAFTIHMPALAARLHLNEHRWSVFWKLLSIGASRIPLVGEMAMTRDVWSLKKDLQQEQELQQQARRSPGVVLQQSDDDLAKLVLDYLRKILNPQDSATPTVPVVLFVDDAQWSDPYTLKFLRELWESARVGWPLLIVATHWDDEWEYHRAEPFAADQSPERLVHLLRVLNLPDEPGVVHRIEKLSDATLRPVVRVALPGLTDEQTKLLLAKSDGNPRLLEEYVKLLLGFSKWFEDRDPAKSLTPHGEKELRELSTDLHQVIKLRFKRMEEHVQAALGWCSVQGDRFLADITQAVGRLVAPGRAENELADSLSQGDTFHRMVQLRSVEGDPGRFNRGEFRQAAFHHVAREVLAEDPVELEAVERAVCATLFAWIIDGSIDHLPEEERRDVLLMARHKLRPKADAAPQAWSVWGTAMTQLIALDASQFLWEQALHAAREFADARPEGWPIETVSVWPQLTVVVLLTSWRDFVSARRLVSALCRQLEQLTEARSDQQALHDLVACQQRLGDIEWATGQRDAARRAFITCSRVAEQNVREFGALPRSLRDVSVSLDSLGDVELALGERDSALERYRRSLDLSELIVREYGASPQSRRDVIFSLNKLGDVELAQGERDAALARYRRSLELSELIVSYFGASQQSLLDVSVSLHRVGDVELALGERDSALERYRRSLDLSEQIVREFEASMESLRNVSVSLERVGDVELALGERDAALARYRRSLDLREQIRREFGESPENLRDVSVSLSKVGDMELVLGERDAALARYRRSLELNEQIVRKFGALPEYLRDVGVSLERVGNVELALGERDSALARYRRSLDLREQIVREVGASPESLRDISVSLSKVGDVELALGQRDSALARYRRSLDLREQIVREVGVSPESLRDIVVSEFKLGVAEIPDDRASASQRLQRARELTEQIIARGWGVPQNDADLQSIDTRLAELTGPDE